MFVPTVREGNPQGEWFSEKKWPHDVKSLFIGCDSLRENV